MLAISFENPTVSSVKSGPTAEGNENSLVSNTSDADAEAKDFANELESILASDADKPDPQLAQEAQEIDAQVAENLLNNVSEDGIETAAGTAGLDVGELHVGGSKANATVDNGADRVSSDPTQIPAIDNRISAAVGRDTFTQRMSQQSTPTPNAIGTGLEQGATTETAGQGWNDALASNSNGQSSDLNGAKVTETALVPGQETSEQVPNQAATEARLNSESNVELERHSTTHVEVSPVHGATAHESPLDGYASLVENSPTAPTNEQAASNQVARSVAGGQLNSITTASATNQLADHMISAKQSLTDGRAQLEVTLDPPELGRVTIELTETDDRLTAKLIVAEESTLTAIRNSMQSILDSLTTAGISLDDFKLESSTGHDLPQEQTDSDARDHDPKTSAERTESVSDLQRNATAGAINILV